YDKDIEGQVERRCPRLFESSFYLVSKIEGNNDVGFKFFYNDIYESDTNNNNNSFSAQNHISILNDGENPLTIRAIINAAQYSSGYSTIQSLLPGIVKVSFTTTGQIERRCKRTFEDDFYMVSKVSGCTYLGLQFNIDDDNSKLFAWTSAVDYWPSPRK
ncbi:20620_t:CDS:2, partial [Gigaspora margarita]